MDVGEEAVSLPSETSKHLRVPLKVLSQSSGLSRVIGEVC